MFDAISLMLNRSFQIARKRTIALVVLCVFVLLGLVILLVYPPSTETSMPILLLSAHSESSALIIDSVLPTPPAHVVAGEPKAAALPFLTAAPLSLLIASPPENVQASEDINRVVEEDLKYLAARKLLIPVAGVTASQLRDSFNDGRSEGRPHEAIDIMAPQATPVLATADGVLVKLFLSVKGGITIYQRDRTGPYIYYYAHLMRYADGIAEGKQLRRGDVIAYVGDTGNAGAGNFHLHFSISKLTTPNKWSGGDPINPYPLLGGK